MFQQAQDAISRAARSADEAVKVVDYHAQKAEGIVERHLSRWEAAAGTALAGAGAVAGAYWHKITDAATMMGLVVGFCLVLTYYVAWRMMGHIRRIADALEALNTRLPR